MSSVPQVRRTDRLMSEEQAHQLLQQGFCGRLATVSEDGSPYCVPVLFVVKDRRLYVHSTAARGHLRANVEYESRVCFEIDEPGRVFDYGRFECDSSVSYRSVIAFGITQIVTNMDEKHEFLGALMQKYGTLARDRPRGFFPRIDRITVYKMNIDRVTGKEQALPEVSQ